VIAALVIATSSAPTHRPGPHYAAATTSTDTVPALITFYHAAAGYPVKSTWIAAIANGHYNSWPGLTADRVRRHLTEPIATVKGHLSWAGGGGAPAVGRTE
jgi:hypothetical protein